MDDKHIELGNERNKPVPDSKLSDSSAQAASAEQTATMVVQLIGNRGWCPLPSPDRKPQNRSLSWTTTLAATCQSQQAVQPAAGLIGRSNGSCPSPEDAQNNSLSPAAVFIAP